VSHKIGEIDISPKNLTTPYLWPRIRHLEFSSPEGDYDIKVEHHQGKPRAGIQHQKTDRERHKIAKGSIAPHEEQLRKLEEAEKSRQEEEKQQEKMILNWETCDRIARGINDFLRRAVESVQDPGLKVAQSILVEKTMYRYCYLFYLLCGGYTGIRSIPMGFHFPQLSALSNCLTGRATIFRNPCHPTSNVVQRPCGIQDIDQLSKLCSLLTMQGQRDKTSNIPSHQPFLHMILFIPPIPFPTSQIRASD